MNAMPQNTELQLHHVCVRVSDLQAAAAFYGELLGLDKLWEFTLAAEHARDLLGIGQDCRFTTYACGSGRLEIFSAGNKAIAPVPGSHFCLILENRDALAEKLRRAGVLLRETLREGRRIVFASDPDGNWIELKKS